MHQSRRSFGSKKPSRANNRAVVAQIVAAAKAAGKPVDRAELSRCYGLKEAEIEAMEGRSA